MKKEKINTLFKLVIGISLLIASISISYYYIIYLPGIDAGRDAELSFNNDNIDTEFIFNKTRECSKYKTEIKLILKEEEDDWNSPEYPEAMVEFDEIFYSPSNNSCLYSYNFYAYGDNRYMDFFKIIDYFTDEDIYSSGYFDNYKSSDLSEKFEEEDKFEDMKEKLKKS